MGPIKYIAAFIYGDNPDTNVLEKAVVWVIIVIVFVFDPLAVLLLLASQMSFQWAFAERKEKESIWAKIKEEMRPKDKDEELTKEEPKYEKDDGPLTEQQVEQIIETAPKPKEPSVVQSYLFKPGVFFKWRPQPKEEIAPVVEPKIEPVVEETKIKPIIEEVKVQEVKLEETQPLTVDTTEIEVNEKGNVVKVNFGDPNLSIKRDDPERRRSFRARHNCDNAGPKTKARYWSCKYWSSTPVSKLD